MTWVEFDLSVKAFTFYTKSKHKIKRGSVNATDYSVGSSININMNNT